MPLIDDSPTRFSHLSLPLLSTLLSLHVIRLLEIINDRLKQPYDPVLNSASIDLPQLPQHHVHPLHRLLPLQILLQKQREARWHLRPHAKPVLAAAAVVLAPPPPPSPQLVEHDADEEEEDEQADDVAVNRRGGIRVYHP